MSDVPGDSISVLFWAAVRANCFYIGKHKMYIIYGKAICPGASRNRTLNGSMTGVYQWETLILKSQRVRLYCVSDVPGDSISVLFRAAVGANCFYIGKHKMYIIYGKAICPGASRNRTLNGSMTGVYQWETLILKSQRVRLYCVSDVPGDSLSVQFG